MPADTPAASPLAVEVVTTRFGDGVVADLPAVLDRLGLATVLVVTDEGVEGAGLLDAALDPLAVDRAVHRATTEPSTDDFDALPDGPFDGVLAVGGGSVLDTAKVAALLAAHGGHPGDYIGEGTVPGPVAPLVAVPTTSGTGSQATQSAVVAHEGVKRGISDEVLRPDVAVVDPALTRGLPRDVTATSGYDAFVHALESWLARDHRWVPERPIRYQGANPVSRPLSRRALDLTHAHLERAVFDGDDLEARRAMSLGAHLAGVAFSNAGLGAVHALASTVGGLVDAPHGACLGASVRAGLDYNRPVRAGAYAALARDLGLVEAGATDARSADALVDACVRLADGVGLPTSFADVGLGPDDLDAMVEHTLVQERRLTTNPRAVVEADLRETLAAAL